MTPKEIAWLTFGHGQTGRFKPGIPRALRAGEIGLVVSLSVPWPSFAQPIVGCLGPMNICAIFSPIGSLDGKWRPLDHLGIGAMLKPKPASERAFTTSAVASCDAGDALDPAPPSRIIPNHSSP